MVAIPRSRSQCLEEEVDMPEDETSVIALVEVEN